MWPKAGRVNVAHHSLKSVQMARHYQDDIILWCVRWYLRYPISFAHMAEMAAERGLPTTAS
jgi:transposase-like protein